MTCKVTAGGIYKVPFPFSDLSKNKSRPALAIESPNSQGDVRFVFITTTAVENIQQGFLLAKRTLKEKRYLLTHQQHTGGKCDQTHGSRAT